VRSDRSLFILSVLAAAATLAGVALSIRSLAGLSRTAELYRKKTADIREVAVLRNRMHALRALVAERERQTGQPVAIQELLQAAVPSRTATTRELDPMPTVPGWTARRVSVALNDITGDELGRLFQEAARARPGWTPIECTLFAAPAPGRLSKADVTMVTVERAGR
jgi:hypothetical protein